MLLLLGALTPAPFAVFAARNRLEKLKLQVRNDLSQSAFFGGDGIGCRVYELI